MTRIHRLQKLGQSIWLDYIRRAFIQSGELRDWLERGVTGITSNPSIFEKAIAGSADYDDQLLEILGQHDDLQTIYERLVVEDIGQAADLLLPVYQASAGVDGYVSLEVRPSLADDTAGTVGEAGRLIDALKRPNIMIKVPATPAGIPAIRALTRAGINVNVTLIFSVAQYEQVAQAYLQGLEDRLADGHLDLAELASVASFFVSRVDSAVDAQLEKQGAGHLRGMTGIANARLAYARFQALFSGPRWQKLAGRGARVQRPLWASTSTKDPALPDTLYVDALVGPDTVNTVPPKTLNAFLESGQAAIQITEGLEAARQHMDALEQAGIDLDKVTQRLQVEGVAAFASSFKALMESIAAKRDRLQSSWQFLWPELGAYQDSALRAREKLRAEKVMARIWSHDHTVWKPTAKEITNRLGWLHTIEFMQDQWPHIAELAQRVRSDGLEQVLLLGMGGSSLAPEVFQRSLGRAEGMLDLSVLDSTHPQAVLQALERNAPRKTLYIVASKSGGTVETHSFFKFFYNRVLEAVGAESAGDHFVAITDPGSRLERIGQEYAFRATFLNDPNIGGRYSALSYFGLVPAALVGVDVPLLLDRAERLARNAESCNCPVEGDNHAANLGAVMGQLAREGRDKLTLVLPRRIESLGDWIEQLIAESTGKEGKGILPVVAGEIGPAGAYGADRLFVYVRLAGEPDTSELDGKVRSLAAAGHPLLTLQLHDLYDLGGQFFLWEMATAVAGYFLEINPFDQPNVESAKILARQMVDEYNRSGQLSQVESVEPDPAALHRFLQAAAPGDYIALQAYLAPSKQTTEALQRLRTGLRDRYRLATTVGYGPRFLHSTGQLHKGDAGNGFFIQFSADIPEDADIPSEAGQAKSSIRFGVLISAQAAGDRQALMDAGRPVIRFDLGPDPIQGLSKLIGRTLG